MSIARARTLYLFLLFGCAASAPPEVAAPTVTVKAAPAPPAPAKPVAPVVLSPGMVLIGDVVAPPQFDPKPGLQTLKPEFLRCYNEARLLTPDLHGKLTLQIQMSGSGSVTLTTASPGSTLVDAGMLACIGDAAKAVTFPKAGGIAATMTVPLVFRP